MAKVNPPKPSGSATPVSIPLLQPIRPIAPIAAGNTVAGSNLAATNKRLVGVKTAAEKKKKEDETFQWSDIGNWFKHPSRIYEPSLKMIPAAGLGLGKLAVDVSRQVIPAVPFLPEGVPQPHSNAFVNETVTELKKLGSGELFGDIGRAVKRGEFPLPETIRVAGDAAIVAGAVGKLAGAAAAGAGSLGAEAGLAAEQSAMRSAAAKVAKGAKTFEHGAMKLGNIPFSVPIEALDRTFAGLAKAQRYRASLKYAEAERLLAENPASAEAASLINEAKKLESRYGKAITVGGITTIVTNKAINKFGMRVTRRAAANADRINSAMLEINDKPEFYDQVNPETGQVWGKLSDVENQAVLSIVNGRAPLIRVIAEKLGMTPGEVAHMGRLDFTPKYSLTPEGANLAVDFLNNNVSEQQYARLATAAQKISDVLETQSELARAGYGRKAPLGPGYDVPTPFPDRLAKSLADNGRGDLAQELNQLIEQGFFDNPQDPSALTTLQIFVEQAPIEVALDPMIYPAKERNNIVFYKRVREGLEANAAFTVRGTPPPREPGGPPVTPLTEGPATGLQPEARYTDVKYPGELSRTPRRFIQNSMKVLENMRGRARVLAERIADTELSIAKKEKAIIKINYQIEELAGGWVDAKGNRIHPNAEGMVPSNARRIPGKIEKLQKQRNALRAAYNEMLSTQAQSTVMNNVVVSEQQLADALAKTEAALEDANALVEMLDKQVDAINESISQVEADQAQIANQLEDEGTDPQPIIDAANKDGEAFIAETGAIEDVAPEVADAQVAEADLQDAQLAAEEANQQLTQARLKAIDARSAMEEANRVYNEAPAAAYEQTMAPSRTGVPSREQVMSVLNQAADEGQIPTKVVKAVEKAYDTQYVPPKQGASAKTVDKIAFSTNNEGGAGGQRGLIINVVNGELYWTDGFAVTKIDPNSALGKKLAQSGNEPGMYRTTAKGRARADIERAPWNKSDTVPNIAALFERPESIASAKQPAAQIVGTRIAGGLGDAVVLQNADGTIANVLIDNVNKVAEAGDTLHFANPESPIVVKRNGEVIGMVMPVREPAGPTTAADLYQMVRNGQFGSLGPVGELLDNLPTEGKLAAPTAATQEKAAALTAEVDAADTAWSQAQDVLKAAEDRALAANNALRAAQERAAATSDAVPVAQGQAEQSTTTKGRLKPPGRQPINFEQNVARKLKTDIDTIVKARKQTVKTPAAGAAETEAIKRIEQTVTQIARDIEQNGLQLSGAANVGVEWAAQTALTPTEFADQISLGPELNTAYVQELRFTNHFILNDIKNAINDYIQAEIEYQRIKPSGKAQLRSAEVKAAEDAVNNARRTIVTLQEEYESNATLGGAISQELGGATIHLTDEQLQVVNELRAGNVVSPEQQPAGLKPFGKTPSPEPQQAAAGNKIAEGFQASKEALPDPIARLDAEANPVAVQNRQASTQAERTAAKREAFNAQERFIRDVNNAANPLRQASYDTGLSDGGVANPAEATRLREKVAVAQKELGDMATTLREKVAEYIKQKLAIDVEINRKGVARTNAGVQKSITATRQLGFEITKLIDEYNLKAMEVGFNEGLLKVAEDGPAIVEQPRLNPVKTPTDAVVEGQDSAAAELQQSTAPVEINDVQAPAWETTQDGAQRISTGYREYELARVEVGTTKSGKPKYGYELRRFGTDGEIINSATQRFGSEAAAKKYVDGVMATDAEAVGGRAVFRPGRELGTGSDTPMPPELIAAENRLAKAKQRLLQLQTKAGLEADRIDKLRIDNAKRRAQLPELGGAMARLEARLGKEIITQTDVAVTEGGPTGRVFVAGPGEAPRLLAPLDENGIPRRGGAPLNAGLRPIAEYTVDNVGVDLVERSVDEANMRRAEMLGPSIPLRVAMDQPFEPGQNFRGSQYVPAGNPPSFTAGAMTETTPGLTGNRKLPSEYMRTGEYYEYYDIIELSKRLAREQRQMDLNEAYRFLLSSRFAVTPEKLLGPDLVAKLENQAYEMTYQRKLTPEGQPVGYAAYAEGNPRRDYWANDVFRKEFGRLLNNEMERRGFRASAVGGDIAAGVNFRDVNPQQPYLPAYVREKLMERREVGPLDVRIPKAISMYLKGASKITGLFKDLTLPLSQTWQLGDIIGNFISAGVTGVDPGTLAQYIEKAIKNNYRETAAGVSALDQLRNVFKETSDQPVNAVGEAIAESGLQDTGLRISQQRRLRGLDPGEQPRTVPQRILNKITPDLPRPTLEGGELGWKKGNIGNVYPEVRRRMYRVNEAINKVMRQAYFMAKLDQALLKIAEERGVAKLTVDDVVAENLHLKDPQIKAIWEDTVDAANEVLGDWLDLTPAERQFVLPNVTFYAWIKHINKLFMKVARENPSAITWSVYLGQLAYDPNADPMELLANKARTFGGFASANFLNPFADVIEGPLGKLLLDADPRAAAATLSPLPRILGAGAGVNVGRMRLITRPYGTGSVGPTGGEMPTILAAPNRWNEWLGYSMQQFPLLSKTLDLLPSGQLPGTTIQTGPFERYDTGAARLGPRTRQKIEKVGGRPVAALRLVNLPFLPTTNEKKLQDIKTSAVQRLRAFEKAKAKAEAIND